MTFQKQKIVPYSFFFILCLVCMLPLAFTPNAEAAGNLKYYDKAHEIIREIDEILVRRGVCIDSNDCNKKLVRFADWESWGIGIETYGIQDGRILNELVGICSRHFFENKGQFEIRVDIYSRNKTEMLAAPFWSAPRATKIIMKGGTNDAKR
jgi:hypothetical protein